MPKSILHISDGAVIALHGCVLIGEAGGEPVSAAKIAAEFRVSAAHVSKVMQRLCRAGVLKSARGPDGGFLLNGSADKITLRRVVEAADGKLFPPRCLLGRKSCLRKACMLGDFAARFETELNKVLSRTLKEASLYTYGKMR